MAEKDTRLLWEVYDAVMEELTVDDEWRQWGGDWFNPLIYNAVNKARERVEKRLEKLMSNTIREPSSTSEPGLKREPNSLSEPLSIREPNLDSEPNSERDPQNISEPKNGRNP